MIPVPVWDAMLCPSKTTGLPVLICCPHLCSPDPLIAISVLLAIYLFIFLPVESVRRIDTSRTHSAQSNQLVFQRVVVRYWLECTARRRCRYGICRIILVFAHTGARATTTNNHSGKAGEEKLMFFFNMRPLAVYLFPGTIT